MSAHKFVVIDDATVVLREKGIYRQTAVYALGNRLFAEYRKGMFIALLTNDGTSCPAATWSELDTPFKQNQRDGRITRP
jgi:hypothetical protein